MAAPDDLPDPLEAIERASFDPTGPAPPGEETPRWWGNHLGEVRWQAEFARLLVDPVFRGHGVPRGDGAPVLLIPGFLAGDSSLRVLRGWLGRIGHRAAGSGIVSNVDCSETAVRRLERRVAALHAETGRRVAVVGHSRGGHFAKALAKRDPERVRAVVSIGAGLDAPFDISVPTKAAVALVRAVHARTSDRIARNGCLTESCSCRFAREYRGTTPDGVVLTSIYSRGDGVVRWPACVVPYARNVEVSGSHVGLAFNRRVYAELARALAATPD